MIQNSLNQINDMCLAVSISDGPCLGLYVCYYRVKVKVTLEEATKAQRGSRGIALLFFSCCTVLNDHISPGQELQAHTHTTDDSDIRPLAVEEHNERNPRNST